jgi:WD40 repeat protein
VEKPLSGTVLLVYQKHKNSVLSLAWSPDGKRIALGNGTVQVWDIATGL